MNRVSLDYRKIEALNSPPCRSCQNCKNASIKSGGGLDEPPWEDFSCDAWEAITQEAREIIQDTDPWDDCTYDKLGEMCGKYTPHMIEKCGVCGARINVPEYLWPLWVPTAMNYDPVCSEGCQVVGEAQYYDQYYERMRMKEARFGFLYGRETPFKAAPAAGREDHSEGEHIHG